MIETLNKLTYRLTATSNSLFILDIININKCMLCCLFQNTMVVSRKSRKGAAAKILLNLCASLIALQVTLYLAEFIGSSRLGCKICNALRYYVIMTSLLWNGVEAYNIYRMLVKVFSGDTSWFVFKAGIVAWGKS